MRPSFEKYAGFTEEEFAADEYFQQYVLFAHPVHISFWKEFLRQYPSRQPAMEKAADILLSITSTNDPAQSLSISEKEEMRLGIMSKLKLPPETGLPVYKKQPHIFRWVFAASAAILAGILIIPFITPTHKTLKQETLSWQTGADEMKEVILADSSRVILNANSILTVTGNLATANSRDVSIAGNGFFKVHKLPGHIPFVVHTGEAAVTVLGTMFNVDTRKGAAEVALTEGAVKIMRNSGPAELTFLKPGEKVRWDGVTKKFIKSAIDVRVYKGWTDGQWHFSSTALSDVASLIHDYYGKDVEFASGKISQLRITAIIPANDLNVLSNVLAKTFHLDIQIENNRVYIQ